LFYKKTNKVLSLSLSHNSLFCIRERSKTICAEGSRINQRYIDLEIFSQELALRKSQSWRQIECNEIVFSIKKKLNISPVSCPEQRKKLKFAQALFVLFRR
jgi:hypothetical protein